MAVFVVLALLMVVIALALLLPTLWRRPTADTTDRVRQNVTIVQEQLALLEASLAANEVTPAQYQQIRDELEAGLLQDTAAEADRRDPGVMPGHGRWTAVLLACLFPVFIAGGYVLLGTPEVFDLSQLQAQQDDAPHGVDRPNMPSVDEMLTGLEQKLVEQPENRQGWLMAGRSYMALQRYADAARAFKQAHVLDTQDAAALFRYADALAMSRGGRLAGEPLAVLKQGLRLEPNNAMGLWLSGNAHAEQANYREAIKYWQRARQQLQMEPAAMQELDTMIAAARQRLSGEAAEAMAQKETPVIEGITLSVALAPALQQQAAPQDTVFIYARAVDGSAMPLAVARRQVQDLPLTITLTDEMAMTPTMSLSGFTNIMLIARVSKTGSAMPQPGDLVGQRPVANWRKEGQQSVMIETLLEASR